MKAVRLVNRCESHQPGDIAVSLITRTKKGQTSQETKKKREVNCEKNGENRGNHRKKGENIGKQRKT